MNEPKRRGFASMDPMKRREIASKGGQAAQDKGTAHRFTSEEGRQARQRGTHPEIVDRLRESVSLIKHLLGEHGLRMSPQAQVSVLGSLYIGALIEARKANELAGLRALDKMITKLQMYRSAADATAMEQVAIDTADEVVAH